MKDHYTPPAQIRNRQGVALITVVSLLAVATLLLLALFSMSESELKSTTAYTNGASARQNADVAVNIVIGQLQRAIQQDSATTGREIWSSQPGMVRQYRENGMLLRANKLYSDQEMVVKSASASVSGEFQALEKIIKDAPPVDWDLQKEIYVDMNEPVIRMDSTSATPVQKLYFPIVDPRAYNAGDTEKSVEGFSYKEGLNGVVLSASPNEQRLAMPVEWLYVLKDGTIGYLDATKKFVGAGGESATIENAIVSRLAFWTDDESCKININTAGEGTFWGTPRVYHDRDGEWANYQPMIYEYQRYPGHPATTSLSTVLFPGQEMNPPRSNVAAFAKSVELKEKIYDLMPKLLQGGSKAGSIRVPVGGIANFTPTDFANVQDALRERLFASLDDFLLKPKIESNGEREEIDLGTNGLWSGVDRAEVIERTRFFLTTNSRSPETNPFGFPKIAMWPLHATAGATAGYRTTFDKTIAHSATIANKAYYFTRQDSTSQEEVDLGRNRQLFTYLMSMTDNQIPGFGANAQATFASKYGDNREQILIEIFDYIRSTNLYDESLAEGTVGANPAIAGLPNARVTSGTAGMASKTFTPMRNSTGTTYPGHGQVTPSVRPKASGGIYRGMGRFLTVSELGLHFIACAEGTTKAGGVSTDKITASAAGNGWVPDSWKGAIAGSSYNWGKSNKWHSNFPPLTGANRIPANGFYRTKYSTPQNPDGDKLPIEGASGTEIVDGVHADHPGYNPINWNWTLDKDTPLPAGTKRMQANLMLEWFSPSAGWGRLNPDMVVEIDASDLTIEDAGVTKRLFPMNNGKVLLRPYNHMSAGWGVYERGGTVSYRPFLQGRKLPAVSAGLNGFTKGSMPADGGQNATGVPTSGNGRYDDPRYKAGVLQDCNKYNLISDYFDSTDGQIHFKGGKVKISLMKNTESVELNDRVVFQEFTFDFTLANFESPLLVVKSENTESYQEWNGSWTIKRPVAAPYWWSFHGDGALGRTEEGKTLTQKTDGNWDSMMNTANGSWGGRFRFIGDEIGTYGNSVGQGKNYRGNLAVPEDCIQSLVLRHGDPRLVMGQYEVPSTEFVPHRYYGNQRLAHNLVFAHWGDGPGLDKGEDKKGWRLVMNANYASSYVPDHPYTAATGAGLQRYGDFDRATANQTDGAYINKPDEGNTYSSLSASTNEQGVPYFTDPWVAWMGGATYFSPNRQIASPGMFGSLPTGVINSGTTPAGRRREAWRTLFFRPQAYSEALNQSAHIGAPRVLKGFEGASGLDVGGVNPPDYLFLDFFWMPVVEPYAISEPGSTAGKININYQMVPFTHIKRATGLHAVMKGELITAIASVDAPRYLGRPGGAPANETQTWFWKEDGSASGKKFWHRQIDMEATTRIFDERFSSGFSFISPAQICEMHLLPKKGGVDDTLCPSTSQWPAKMTDLDGPAESQVYGIRKFWENHGITGENLKERPYTNIYPRLTTRSNTFQVYVRSQLIAKARSADVEKFVEGKDSIKSEYRGSVVIERYMVPSDTAIPDYALGNTAAIMAKEPLDKFHRFRIVSQKRFNQ